MSVIQAVLLGILGGLGIWDSRVMGLCMMERPLFLGPVVGLILGDFQTGIVVGASLELVMMGIVGIGSATIPDTVSASILGQLVGVLVRTANGYFAHQADKAAERGDYKGVDRALWGGAGLFFIAYFLLVFFGALLGSTVIGAFVDKLPQSVIHGFSVASGMLPALGIAILMQLLFDKKNVVFFFVGWALSALLGVNTVGAAVIGTTIAYIMFQYGKGRKGELAAVEAVGEMSDDLGGEL